MFAFEKWKYERAIAQGRTDTIEIQAPVGLLGIPGTRVLALADAKPEECAVPDIRSAFDLFWRLHDEKYTPINDAVDKLGPETLAVLLAKRDALTMPLSSLALVARMLWLFTESKASAYSHALSEDRCKKVDNAAHARAQRALKNSQAFTHAEWKSMAASLWRSDFSLLSKQVAGEIRRELSNRSPRVHHLPAIGTIKNAIKGVKGSVRLERQRSHNRS